MAKINSKTLVVTLNKLVKDTDQDNFPLDDTVKESLVVFLTELLGPGIIVEIEEV